MPRVRAELIEQRVSIGQKRVACLMRLARIRDISRHAPRQTQVDANDLDKRRFKTSDPNQLWMADMPCVSI